MTNTTTFSGVQMPEPRDRQGLECPECGCFESTVVWIRHRSYTLQNEPVTKTVRKRECAHCGARFTTKETVNTD